MQITNEERSPDQWLHMRRQWRKKCSGGPDFGRNHRSAGASPVAMVDRNSQLDNVRSGLA